MKKRGRGKKLWSLFLTLAMVFTMVVAALPVSAAEDGTATVQYDPAKLYGLETEFKLYKVGHFEHYKAGDTIPEGAEVGYAYLALDEGIPDVGGTVDVSIRKEAYPDTEQGIKDWTAAWQASAAALESVIDSTSVTPKTAKCNADGDAVFTGLEDGLYLVTGPKQRYEDAETQVSTNFKPNASFILVFEGEAALTVKYEEAAAKEYVITKVWVIPDKYKALKPESIDVQLYYRDMTTDDEDSWTKGELITLSEENNWTYEWSSNPDYDWKWEEILTDEDKLHFSYSYDQKDDQYIDGKRYITLVNTYEKRQLEIIKILDQFLDNGDNAATFEFEIRGFMGDGDNEKQVYTAWAGINFKDKAGTLKTLVDNIPVNLTRLEVEEVYSGNYKAVGAKKMNAVLNSETGLYTVTFENEFNDDITIDGGIVNKYTNEDGKIVLSNKDTGNTPGGAQEE